MQEVKNSFNPSIITKDAESAIALFEALGFERRHTKDGFRDDVSAVRMKDSENSMPESLAIDGKAFSGVYMVLFQEFFGKGCQQCI